MSDCDEPEGLCRTNNALANALNEVPLAYHTPSVRPEKTAAQPVISLQFTEEATANQHSPFNILPSELLREVISLAISNTNNRPEILRLSHVSRRFRDTVVDMPTMFIEADWNDWDISLVELWCWRARDQLLKIHLNATTARSLGVGAAPKRALLESCSSRWGTMMISLSGAKDANTATGLKRLLENSAPSLHTLGLCSSETHSPWNQITLNCAPPFRVLHLDGTWIRFPASHVSVTDLTCALKGSEWIPCMDAITSCPLLHSLTLELYDCEQPAREVARPHMDAVLSSLLHLGLKGIIREDLPLILQLFGHLDTPNVNSLKIEAHFLTMEACVDFFMFCVSDAFPIRVMIVSRHL